MITMDQLTSHEDFPGSHFAEASDLGLAPGEFPHHLTVQASNGEFWLERRSVDSVAAHYSSAGDLFRLVVTSQHPFERSGNGRAPFSIVGFDEKTYQACHGAPVQPAGICDHCGTCIRYRAHIASSDGVCFVVGLDCVRKTAGTDPELADAAGRELRRIRRKRAQERKDRERKARRGRRLRAFLQRERGILRVLRLRHPVLADLRRSLARFGSLTDAQVELAYSLALRLCVAERRAAEPTWIAVPWDRERVEVEGEVLTVRSQPGAIPWETEVKMLVRVDLKGGSFKLWGTCPRALWDVQRGARVHFRAEVRQGGRDPEFGFFSRPTSARVVARGGERE